MGARSDAREGERTGSEEPHLRRGRVVAARDVWIEAGHGRAFQASVNRARTEWRIQLTEGGEVVASGAGDTWETALDDALRSIGMR
jgi:hypothetical protein